MRTSIKVTVLTISFVLFLVFGVFAVYAWTPLPVKSDPLVRMPGTQPENGVALESPNRCLNCHAGYNPSVEPGFNWMGSMMAQSARDFIFWPAMTVAAQDAIWATGNPNATDICLRCHFPKGWLEGRSDPTNATLMGGADYDGVQCDFCHRMYDPFYADTHAGLRESPDRLGYWDETDASNTPSTAAANGAFLADQIEAQAILMFNGEPFYLNDHPQSAGYLEATSGQYFVSTSAEKRASFADAAARHQMLYSRFHKSKYMCATCHDVSNPVLANLGGDPLQPLATETQFAGSFFHVERTFSEFMLSAYGREPNGAAGIGPFAPDVFETSLPGNYIGKCQDCHMRDVVGTGANKNGVPVRPTDSIEHPQSGQPLHDLTGGNVWVSYVLASAIPGSPNYDLFNDQLLNQGAATLTLDLTQGLGVNPAALIAGSERAAQQLQLAASIEEVVYDPATGALSFKVQNQTGHKLISGFPEGRRMYINIRAYAGGILLQEINPYDVTAGTLKGLPNGLPLGSGENYVDELVYEMHPSSSLTGEEETLHFVLADDRYKDNRIPPAGFDFTNAASRLSQPRWHGADALDYFTAAEYAGGYDQVDLTLVPGADTLEINLYYQTTSREYVEFLRDEINGTNPTLPDPTAYIIQTDPFFSQLKAWGDTVWQLWEHNKDLPGAAPFLMAQAIIGSGGSTCTAPIPTILAAVPDNKQVLLSWSDEHSSDAAVTGYSVYYDQSDKSQPLAQLGLETSFLDINLTNGQMYCYKVTSITASCESDFSASMCATPNSQTVAQAGVDSLVTGFYSGKGGNKTFNVISTFTAGDTVVIRVVVLDAVTGLPVPGAIVDLEITGPESLLVTTGSSDATGLAEASWSTQAPKGNRPGTLPGTYTVTVTNVTGGGIVWDGVPVTIDFNLGQ